MKLSFYILSFLNERLSFFRKILLIGLIKLTMGEKKHVSYIDDDAGFFIDSLWILEKSSGLCVFEENYVDFTKNGVSSDLVASFLSALLTFAGETFSEEIQYVKFSNRKIYFHVSDYVLYVIAINTKQLNNYYQIERLKRNIARSFNKKYEWLFKYENWSNNISMFNEFSDILRNIVKKDPISKKHVQSCFINKSCAYFDKFQNKKLDSFGKLKERLKSLDDHAKKCSLIT